MVYVGAVDANATCEDIFFTKNLIRDLGWKHHIWKCRSSTAGIDVKVFGENSPEPWCGKYAHTHIGLKTWLSGRSLKTGQGIDTRNTTVPGAPLSGQPFFALVVSTQVGIPSIHLSKLPKLQTSCHNIHTRPVDIQKFQMSRPIADPQRVRSHHSRLQRLRTIANPAASHSITPGPHTTADLRGFAPQHTPEVSHHRRTQRSRTTTSSRYLGPRTADHRSPVNNASVKHSSTALRAED